jgi:uncharacterized membrane protein
MGMSWWIPLSLGWPLTGLVRHKRMETFKSDISNKEFPLREKVTGAAMQRSLMQFIKQKHPDFADNSMLAMSELNSFREQFIGAFLEKEVAELPSLQATVKKAMKADALLTKQLESEAIAKYTFGQRLADSVASFGGSWTFILSFGGFILLWISLNVILLMNRGFDPYPFILLNLILSCLAALQAPVIMMSQNRQDEKDRDRAKKDYVINLKSELEIRLLHEKIDHLILHQQLQLIEIQHMQVGMMKEILEKLEKLDEG